MRVSHETIYQSLFVQARGALRHELHSCLRSGRVRRRAQHRTAGRGSSTDMVLISERPPRGRRPGGPRPLGGRSHHRRPESLGDRDARRAPDPLRPARRPARRPLGPGRPRRPRGPDREPARAAPPDAHLPTAATRWPSTSGSRSRPASRSTSATPGAPGNGAATRTPTACCGSTSRRLGPVRPRPGPSRCRRPGAQRSASTDARLDETIRGARQDRCVDRLNPPSHMPTEVGSANPG
jgi:hypothetical protein